MSRLSFVFSMVLMSCVSSSIELTTDGGSSPTDAGPRPDTARPDVAEDVPPDVPFMECQVPTDCLLVPESCCGRCGFPERGDILSIPRSARAIPPTCDLAECPGCPGETFPDPTLQPDCVAGLCTYIDLEEYDPGLDLNTCDPNSRAIECVLRLGTQCCECGELIREENAVAINVAKTGLFEAHVCEADISCSECPPIYDEGLFALCEEQPDGWGRCTVIGPSDDL